MRCRMAPQCSASASLMCGTCTTTLRRWWRISWTRRTCHSRTTACRATGAAALNLACANLRSMDALSRDTLVRTAAVGWSTPPFSDLLRRQMLVDPISLHHISSMSFGGYRPNEGYPKIRPSLETDLPLDGSFSLLKHRHDELPSSCLFCSCPLISLHRYKLNEGYTTSGRRRRPTCR